MKLAFYLTLLTQTHILHLTLFITCPCALQSVLCKVCKVPYWHFCFLKGRCSVELLWSSSSIFYLPHLSLLICHAYHLFPPVLSISSISNCIPYHPIFIFCHSSWRSAWQWSALFRSTSWLLLMLLEHASVSCILIKDFTYQRAAEVQTWKW
jgi:hypothetical protein